MDEIDLDNWAAFEEQLQKLENERLQQQSTSEFLYRGQEDHSYNLLSTLERARTNVVKRISRFDFESKATDRIFYRR